MPLHGVLLLLLLVRNWCLRALALDLKKIHTRVTRRKRALPSATMVYSVMPRKAPRIWS
jgi:hypothetical protein